MCAAERNAVRFSVEDEAYPLADYPRTAAILERGGGFVVAADDPEADAGERALLADWGFVAVVAGAAVDRDGTGWLVELFADRHSAAGLTAALPDLRLLVAEAVARAQPATSDAKDSKTST